MIDVMYTCGPVGWSYLVSSELWTDKVKDIFIILCKTTHVLVSGIEFNLV